MPDRAELFLDRCDVTPDSTLKKRTLSMALWCCPALSSAGQVTPNLLMQAQDADASQANIAIIGCCCPLLWLGAMFPVVVVIIHVVYLQLFAKIMAFA